MKKNVAIIFLGDCFYDARCINMMHSLSSQYSVSIICSFEKKLSNPIFDSCNFFQIKLTACGLRKYWEFYKKVLKVLNENQYDYIVAGDLYSLASVALNKQHNKIIYDCREIYSALSAHINKPFYRFMCGVYENYFLKFVDDVLVTAQTDLDYLKKKYFKHKHLNWHVIYNYPINIGVSNPKNLRKGFSIPDDNIMVLYQGVLHKGRGVSKLIKLTSLNSNITAIIIGDGVEKNYYINYAESLNVSNRVCFVDKVAYLELFEYSSCCDVGWAVINNNSLSYSYALPNKLFEYLLSGLPVIASPLENIKNIVQLHNVGELVDFNNSKKQLDAIQVLVKNKFDRVYYRNIALQHFTWDVQKDTFLKIFL